MSVVTNLFPVWTVLFTGMALKNPSAFDWFTTEYFTAALAALMLSMGITLTPADFAAVAQEPVSVFVQFSLCYVMMPLLALGLGKVFGLNAALLAGTVLVGSINGGQASNLCAYIAKGNVALSVLMTTATTIGAIFMTPLLCKLLLGAGDVLLGCTAGLDRELQQTQLHMHARARAQTHMQTLLNVQTSLFFHTQLCLWTLWASPSLPSRLCWRPSSSAWLPTCASPSLSRPSCLSRP